MKKNKGLSLVELLAAITISSILILMVGFLSQIAFSSHEEIRKEGDVYSDLFYGLSRINFLARKAGKLEKVLAVNWSKPTGVSWNSDILIVDNSAFGFYQPTNKKIKFVFIPDKTHHEVTENILEDIATNPLPSFVITPNGKSISINIQGKKLTQDNKLESFVISNFIITRRN